MKGYFNCERETRLILKDGWLHTGDLGKLDKNGYVYIAGLKKRMLNVGGKNVYPSEVERLMRLHENLEAVQVYGDISKLQGNIVKAKIKLREKGAEAERTFKFWCLKNISHYKLPKRMEFY